MGGVLIEVTGTAYGDPQTFFDAWQKAITVKAGFIGGFANDCIDTEIDGQVLTIRREFLVRPDQMVVTIPPDIPPVEPTRDVVTTTPLNVRVTPDTTQKPVTVLAANTQVKVYDRPGEWLQIAAGTHKDKWINGTYTRPT